GALVPGVALLALIGAFVLEGAAGASVIDRYLLGGATLMLLFCAVAIGGWSMLEAGSLLRRVWILAAAALLLYGVTTAASTVSLSSLRTRLAYHEDFHKGLAVALANPKVRAQLHRCPLLSLPNNKLIPDARWILGSVDQRDIVARSQARADVAKHSPALAGAGLGLACASKYTAGIALVPLLAAAAVRLARARSRPAGKPAAVGTTAGALAGLCLSGAIALAAFLIANPYALLDYHSFHA